MKLADTTLGLNSQAIAVLHALSELEAPESIKWSNTGAFYNCREAGIVCSFAKSMVKPGLHIVIVEHRNSDEIRVFQWRAPLSINPPSLADLTEDTYRNREKCFPWLDVRSVVQYVLELVEAYANEK